MDPEKLGIQLDQVLGAGTHGIVYQSMLNERSAVKVVKNDRISVPECSLNQTARRNSIPICNLIDKEYQAQEIIHDELKKHRDNFPGGELLRVPKIYGFAFSPSLEDPQYCSYLMEKVPRLEGLPGLLQIPLGYRRDYYTEDRSGVYMGIDKLREFLALPVEEVVMAMASFHAFLHYGLFCDGYDTEYIISSNANGELQLFVIDFDKVNFWGGKYKKLSDPNNKQCILRKFTEQDYEPKPISNERDIIRVLATSFSYDPRPDYPEYELWKNTYLDVAAYFGQRELAEKVLNVRAQYF